MLARSTQLLFSQCGIAQTAYGCASAKDLDPWPLAGDIENDKPLGGVAASCHLEVYRFQCHHTSEGALQAANRLRLLWKCERAKVADKVLDTHLADLRRSANVRRRNAPILFSSDAATLYPLQLLRAGS